MAVTQNSAAGAQDSVINLLTLAGENPPTKTAQVPVMNSQPLVALTISKIETGQIAPFQLGMWGRWILYTVWVNWSTTLAPPEFSLSCYKGDEVYITRMSGAFRLDGSGRMLQHPGGYLPILCSARRSSGEILGSISLQVPIGIAGDAIATAQTARETWDAWLATELAAETRHAAQTTADSRATLAVVAEKTRAATNNIFTIVGTYGLRQSDSGCTFSTQPSTVGKLMINVDLNQGIVNGTLDGGGGGTRTGLFRSGCGGGDMIWSSTVSGSFAGTANPNSGALAMNGTITGDNKYSYANCKNPTGNSVGCPASGAPHYVLPITITGTIDKASHTGKGAMRVAVTLPTEGDWSTGK